MLFILNRDYQVMGVADNTSEGALHYFNDKLTTDLTAGVSTFEFDVYKTNPTSAFLQEGNYITLKDTHGKQLLFTIMEMEEDSTKKSIYCEDVGLDLLNETVPPLKSATAQPISWYIQQSTNDSGWQVGTNQVSHLKRTLEYEGYSNALQRILSICNSFDGVEVDFTVEFKGNAVTKQLINIYRKRGKDSGLRYNAGIDLAEARRTVSLNDLATALRGVGSEITNKNNEVIGNTTFTNIVYDDGRYFTTKGSPFVFDREANKRWSRYRNMQSATQGYIVDYFEYDTKSEQELFNRALSQLKKRSEPAVEYEIEISKIKDNLMVGDTIEIVDNYFQPALHLQARVLAVTTSETVDSDNKLKLGNFKIVQSSIDEKLLALQEKLNSVKLSWSENNAPVLAVKSTNGEAFFNNYIDTNLNASITRGGIDITNSYTSDEVVWSKRDRFGVNVSGWNRTGFSIPLSIEDINTKNTFVATVDGMEAQITIFNTLTTVESPTAPTEPQQGQIWLDTSVQPPIQKVYLGGKWKHVTPITEEQFEDVKAISELASSGVESLNGELATVKDNVAGKVDSNTYTQKVSAIESALANKVEQAVQQADKLALEAEIAKKVAQTAYDTKVAELNTAIGKKLDTSVANATKVIQDAEIAKKVAQTTYNTKINEIDTAISGHTTRIEATETGLLAKASTTDVNALKTRMSTAETSLTTNANAIALKASQEDLDTVEGRLETTEAELVVQAGEIASKVAKTDFNNLSGRVGTAESTIIQHASEIASRVKQTDFDSLSGRVGTAESSITQQAGEIALKVATTTYNAGIATKENAITKANTAPSHANGKLWLNTSVTPNVLNRSTGTAWVKATPTTASEVGAYSSSEGSALAGRVTTAESTIVQQAGLIESKVSQTDFNGVNGRLKTAESTITQQAGEIALKVAKTDFDTLNGRVGTAETKIATNASQIALKASTSDLNAIDGRLSTAEGSITVNAQNIASKVSQTDFNAVSGRLDTAESTIVQQAGLIESKVAKTTYEADINNATTGLKTKMSNAESRITQTEKDITSKVSQTTYDTDINNATTGLKKRISTAESTITQQAGLIEAKVEKTTYTTELATKANASDVYKKSEVDTKVNAKANNATVNPLITRVSNAESKITQTEKDIALRATKTEAQGYAQTAVDGIQIGGRNLIIKKNALNDIESSSIGLSKWGYLLSNSSKSISLSLNSNEKYALSFLGHNEGSPQNVKIDLSGVENIQKTLSIGTGSNKYTWNFETPNLDGAGKKVYPFQTLDDWIRYYKNSPNLITDVNNTAYKKWGFSGVQLPNMAPVKGGMFGGAFPINGNLHGSVDSPATAWAGINLSKAYMETNDATLLPKIIAIGDYFVRNAINIETWGVSFKAFPNNIEFNEASNTWVANTRFIHTRTFYHVAWALLEIYDVTKDARYSTLAGQLLDGATGYQLVATAQSNSGELPPYFAGSMYNTINRTDDGYLPDWLTFTNTNGDVVMKATKKWIKLFGNTTRTSFDLYAWADVNYTVKSIADNYINHLLYLYKNQGLRKSDGHKLLYCFSHYEWSDTPHSSGYMVPIPMNWDFINEEFGKEQWFTGDLMFWAIIGFAEAGERAIVTALLDRYYELKSPDSEGRLLFYDRYTANGTPLVEDTSKSITFTALYMQARNILGNHNYDSEALLALKHYQKTSPYLTVDGGYSWDTEHSDALIENKSLGEVIYSIFENVSKVKPPLFLTFENTIPNPVYILDIKLETGNKHTDYTPAPEDVEEQVVAIETRVNDAELLITPEAITATVVESEDLTSKLQGYATQESLGNYLSNEDFSTEKENIMGEIDSRIGAIDYSPFVQATELEQKTNAITAKISQAGGVNLIQNSIGWAGKDFWSNFSATAGVSIQNDELSSMGFGSGWYSSASGAFTQKQRLTLPRAGTYTLSFWLKKTVGSSWAYVQVQKGDDTTFANANAFAYAGYSSPRLTDGYELFTTTFEATELDVAVSITIATGVEATITGIMLHEGSEPFKWQPYTSEVYNTNVKMDMNGITVKNNQDAGYTLITPDEFSGYAPVDGTVERVFTLNGDTTEVKKLKAEQQFEMAPVTIITIDNLKYSGWAFI